MVISVACIVDTRQRIVGVKPAAIYFVRCAT